MPDEWKRATWAYDAVGLGHTNVTIVEAMEDFLLACGWERAPWDGGGAVADRYYLRSDRRTVLLTNDLVGTAGNVAITESDADSRIVPGGMSGGTSSVKATGSIALSPLDVFDGNSVTISDGVNPAKTFEFEAGVAAARGRIAFLAQPADGNYVEINDGVNPTVRFEFDSNSSVTPTGTLRQVVIGGTISVTISNLSAAINSGAYTLAVTANVGVTDSVTLANDATGTAGNVALVRVGANLVVTGMTGGGGAAGVAGSNIAVPRGATSEDTINNLVTAINTASAFNITARWAKRWTFNGDGVWQHCGIHIQNDTAASRIVIRCFLQKPSLAGSFASTNVAHQINVVYSQTAPNNFTFFGGEFGFVGECGRDGLKVNLAHWAITTFEPMPELYGTDDDRVGWTTQGLCMDLFGNLKFSENRNLRLVDTANGNRNFTGTLRPFQVRGTTSFDTSTQVADPRCAIGPLDLVLGIAITGSRSESVLGVTNTLGIIFTPRDGRYRISPLLVRQYAYDYIDCGTSDGNVSNTVGINAGSFGLLAYDVRRWRKMTKFAVTDATLIPFVNVIDAVTGVEYYISQVQDGGRVANLCVAWTVDVVSIAATPT